MRHDVPRREDADAVHLCGKQGRYGRPARAYLPVGRGWPRLEAAPSLIGRWRGVLEGELAEASGRLVSTQRCTAREYSTKTDCTKRLGSQQWLRKRATEPVLEASTHISGFFSFCAAAVTLVSDEPVRLDGWRGGGVDG